MWIVIVLGIIAFLLMEHPVALWLVFVPLVLVFILTVVNFLKSRRGYIGNLIMVVCVFLVLIVVIVVVASPDTDKCDHDNLDKRFSFQFEGSTASSVMQSFCDNCNNYFGRSSFYGTPADLSYLDVIEEHSDSDEIDWGEYYTITATVSHADYDFNRTRIGCKVESEKVIVSFSVEFREEFEESVGLLDEGDIVTFRGRFYEEGCGFTDCELITE